MSRATGDPLVAKSPEILGLFRLTEICLSRGLSAQRRTLLILGGDISETKRATEDPLVAE